MSPRRGTLQLEAATRFLPSFAAPRATLAFVYVAYLFQAAPSVFKRLLTMSFARNDVALIFAYFILPSRRFCFFLCASASARLRLRNLAASGPNFDQFTVDLQREKKQKNNSSRCSTTSFKLKVYFVLWCTKKDRQRAFLLSPV